MAADDNEQRILGSIKLAADDLGKLRRCDVYRVLADADQQELLMATAAYICAGRPELASEVNSCLEELRVPEESWISGGISSIQHTIS